VSTLIAIAYDDVATANQVRDTLFQLQTQHLITLEDAVVVERKQDGKIKLLQARGSTAGAGALGGALWGGLIGLIFFMPFLGAAIGAGTGALAGSAVDGGVNDNFMRQVSEKLTPGKAALFVLVVDSTPEKVLPQVARYGGEILQTSLSPEAEEHLRDAVQAAHATV
jgi:uncharacterized membrane protein